MPHDIGLYSVQTLPSSLGTVVSLVNLKMKWRTRGQASKRGKLDKCGVVECGASRGIPVANCVTVTWPKGCRPHPPFAVG